MFGLEDLNLTGLPICPNSADLFQRKACRWRPFGGDEDTGRLFRMSAKCIAAKRSSVLFLCVDVDRVLSDSDRLPDTAHFVEAFLDGRLESQPYPTETGPEQLLPTDLGSPTPEQRRYGFREWIRKLNLAPEILFRSSLVPIDDPTRYAVPFSWYIVSHNHILVEETDDPIEPPEMLSSATPTQAHIAQIFEASQLFWPDWLPLPSKNCFSSSSREVENASFDEKSTLRNSGTFDGGFFSISRSNDDLSMSFAKKNRSGVQRPFHPLRLSGGEILV